MVIEVRDDGRGIDPRKVAEKAASEGLIAAEAVETTDMAKAIELLFHPGFSTADVATDISGRGVGMDAVRTTIRELGGEVLMTSEQGQGTVAQIRLPLTLAIMAALLVEADGRPFAIPLDRIERTVRLADHTVRSVAGSRMLVMRDGVLPIVDAAERFGGSAVPDAEYAVVVRGATGSLAVTVTHPLRPARAGHPAPPARGRREQRPLGRGRHVRRPDRAHRRLRCARDRCSRPRHRLTQGTTRDPVHRTPARRSA